MGNDSRGDLIVLACDSGRNFAGKVCKELEKIVRQERSDPVYSILSKEHHFANSEIKTVLGESIRGGDVIIFQDCENSVEPNPERPWSVDENLQALKTTIDAAWRGDAHYITAVIPVFPYSRQHERKGKEGVTAAMVAREIEDAGADRVLTLDVHNESIDGFFRKAKFENLRAATNIMDYIKDNICTENMCFVSPDEGGAPRANHYAKLMRTKFAMGYKERDYSRVNVVERITLLGRVKGKNVFVVDDMLDTGGTMEKFIRMIKDKKGAEKVYAICSLPLFNGPAIERLDKLYKEGYLNGVISTDAVYHGGEEFKKAHPWFIEVSVAKYFANVIYNIGHYKSISALLK